MEDETAIVRMAEWFLDRAAAIPWKANQRLAEILGRVWYRLDARHRNIAMRNLQLAWGDELNDKDRETICGKVFTHLAHVLLEIPYLRILTQETLSEWVTFSGLEFVEEARRKGKGVLAMACHFGNWEIMALACSLRGYPFKVIVRPLDNPVLDRIIDGLRCRGGNRTIPKKGSVRQVLRLLRQKEIVALLIDQNVDWYDGVFVPFFREIACTNKALAVLALRTGAPVLPIFNVRMPDGRYHVFVEPEVPLIRTGDLISDTEENMANFNRVIEAQVRLHPDQWFWVHQRWKTRPYKRWPRERKV